MQLAPMDKVYNKWHDKARFFMIYHHDPHPDQGIFRGISQPKNMEERLTLAHKLKKDTNMQMPMLIDEVPRKASKLYGGLPNMIYIIDPEGNIAYYNRWTDAREIEEFLQKTFG